MHYHSLELTSTLNITISELIVHQFDTIVGSPTFMTQEATIPTHTILAMGSWRVLVVAATIQFLYVIEFSNVVCITYSHAGLSR